MSEFLKLSDPVAWPIAAAAARLVPKRSPPASSRVLVLRPGGMGDLILAQLAWEALGMPQTEVEWVIERRSEVWARHARLNYQCYDQNSWATFRRLAGCYPLVINSEQRFGLSQAFAAACVSKGGALWAFATNRGAALGRTVPYDWRDEHESSAFHRLFSAAVGRPERIGLIRPVRREMASGPRVIGLAGLEVPSRRLDEATYVDLIRPWLRSESAVICCSPRDRLFAEALARHWPGQVAVYQEGFDAMCQTIARAPGIFCMDGGMVHIASYYGVPATVVFTSGRRNKWAPLAPGSTLLCRTDLACQPCARFGQVPPCRHGYACKRVGYIEHSHPLP